MGKILYLECNSGISGDMTVGALLDLGADREVLEKGLRSLGLEGYHLHFGRKTVCGLDAFDFDVHLEGEGHGAEDVSGHEQVSGDVSGCERVSGDVSGQERVSGDVSGRERVSGDVSGQEQWLGDVSGREQWLGDVSGREQWLGDVSGCEQWLGDVSGCEQVLGQVCEHKHGSEHVSGHKHGSEHVSGHEHGPEHDQGNQHSAEQDHKADYGQKHEHIPCHPHPHSHNNLHPHHAHVHRNLQDICQIIDRLDSNESVKELARRIFRIVAEAESKAHGLPLEQVHFHEVGAIDSIVDIISVALCLDNLGIREVAVSPLAEGQGHVHCQHGILPVPVPATVNIASKYGLELRFTDNRGEMVTPTGAAIAAALRTRDGLPESCRLLKVGMGAGNKVFKQANVLRVMLMEETGTEGDAMWVLESNLDDCTGEALGFAMELLMDAGAADVWHTPIFMKKNRPAYLLSVLCGEAHRDKMEEIILAQTTTIGLRRYQVSRTVLARKKIQVVTAYGPAEVKVCSGKERCFYYPEYESVRAICRETGLDFQTVYQQVRLDAERIER